MSPFGLLYYSQAYEGGGRMYELHRFVNRLIIDGKYREALNQLHSVLRGSRADFDALLDCGYVHSQLDRWDEALVYFRRALMANSFCSEPSRLSFLWYRMSIALMAIYELDAALTAIDQAEQLLATYDHGVDEPEEYARIRAEIKYKLKNERKTGAWAVGD